MQPTCATCVDETVLPDIIKIAVYRVVQEALNNIAKHADAELVKVEVRMVDDGLELTISDDGVGFQLADISPAENHEGAGFGLHSMRERVETTGGDFTIESEPGDGVRIYAFWDSAGIKLLRNEPVLDGVDSHG